MAVEPWGQWVCGVASNGELRCLAIVPSRTDTGDVIGFLRLFDGAAWRTMARFEDVDSAMRASAAIQSLVEAGAVLTFGGPSASDGFGTWQSGVEWVGVGRADRTGARMPGGVQCDDGVTRLHVAPLEDGSVIALVMPCTRKSFVAVFASAWAADQTVEAINDLVVESHRVRAANQYAPAGAPEPAARPSVRLVS